MLDARMLAFLGVTALLTITPGADMAVVTRTALARGWRPAMLATLGICAGLVAWAAASALGLAALLTASATAYNALKFAGAAYLIWLGAQTIWQTFASGRKEIAAANEPGSFATSARGASFRQGLLTNLLNPKVGVFYTTFLPQFVAPGEPVLAKSMLLGSIHIAMGIIWLAFYARLVTRAGDILRREPIKRAIDRLTGLVLIALGVRLAMEER